MEVVREFEHPERWPLPVESNTTAVERAYAAGMVDGEGSVMLITWGSSWLPVVMVTNTDRRVVDWFQARFGGEIQRSHRKSPLHKLALRWRLNGRRATAFLQEILPFLVIKREQAEIALSYYRGAGNFQHGSRPLPREEYDRRRVLHDAISALNRRGIQPQSEE